MNDVRKMIYGTLVGFLGFLVLWISFVYVSGCGLTFSCNKHVPIVERTPIPTLIPVNHAVIQLPAAEGDFNKCAVSATELVGAWVSADSPETDPFPFSDVNGKPCEGTYAADIQPLFIENSLWYQGAIGCVACHNAELSIRSGGLDLSSYDAMLLGSRRVEGSTSPSTDIFGRGNWEKSLLYGILVNQGMTPKGHSPDVPPNQPILYAGQAVAEVVATPTP
ncbi:MAG: hypothetical protein DCC56_09270 [Anaerolineae bacterium]|nr:MAG: hypothetical protein DCC56_09270 [Anaerolineae bacterium]WKZ45220.1 MAG: hypothetical protein QY302_05465 [Anaerolineales bacterium]